MAIKLIESLTSSIHRRNVLPTFIAKELSVTNNRQFMSLDFPNFYVMGNSHTIGAKNEYLLIF